MFDVGLCGLLLTVAASCSTIHTTDRQAAGSLPWLRDLTND